MSKGNAAFAGLKTSQSQAAAVSPPSASDPSGKLLNETVCSGFEGQVFRKNRCKKCLRDKAEHADPQPVEPSTKPSESPGQAAQASINPVGDAPTKIQPPSTAVTNVPGILKTPPTTGKPPPSASPSSSTKRPIVNQPIKAGKMEEQSRPNTTLQTITLSKTSPQIRRASSSGGEPGPRRGPTQDPNRRFSAMEEEEEERQMRTPLSGSLLSMRTARSSTSNSDLQSMHTATSGSMTSLNSDTTYISSREHYQETVDELQATIDSLTEQLDGKGQTIEQLEREVEELREALKTPLSSGSAAGGTGTLKKRDELQTAQKRIRELEKEVVELDKVRRVYLMELEQMRECMDEINDPDEASATLVERVRDMAHKLQSAEMMCEDLLDENQDLKKELRSLEAEMDELHDNFRQDQAMEFQTIQKELEQTMKNCRILQFKLRKAERKCDEVEADKAMYEVKLRQMTSVSASSGPADNAQLREVLHELQQTKDVNKRLQEEIEHIEEERNTVKSSYDNVARACFDLEQQKETLRLQAERLQIEVNSLKPSSSRSLDNGRQNASSAGANAPLGKTNYDVNQLLRDLYDSVERETDLRDQLGFSEEESKRLRKQVTDLEHENDSLQHQLKKLSSARHSGDFSKAGEVVDSMRSNEELKMQLDITEHEISTLKRRLSEAEQTNESLSAEIKSLQVAHDEMKEARDRMCAVLQEPESTGPGRPRSYYEQKIKLLEAETNDLRKKLVDKERQLERLSSEMEVAKRKGGQLNRSKSLDDYQLVDLRRQLQMAEQEIVLLRQKVQALEADNDKLSADYKRLQFKAGSKRPSTEELDVSRAPSRGRSMDEVGQDELASLRSEGALLKNAGKSAQTLLDESASLKKQNEDLLRHATLAKEAYEKAHSKVNIRKDVATRQELKSRIDELEKDFQNATIVVEQERATSKRLLAEVEELRSNMQGQVPNLPISDEVKEARLKLYAAEQQLETLRTEIRDLQENLMEEKRKSRISESDFETKERKDTELRNLKQELSKQRHLVEELTAKDNLSTRQLAEWQKKYLSLKEAYKSDTDAWQKELSDFEQELEKEKSSRASDVTKSTDKEVQSLKHKLGSYEDQIQNLIEAGRIKEKETKDKIGKLERELEEIKKHHDEVSAKLEQQGQELSTEKWKAKVEKDRLESKIATMAKERDDHLESCKKETVKLKTDLENVKKARADLETELEKLKQETKSAVSTYGKGGLSAYERAKAADQIKEEVEKLHKQNYELQRQLLEAKRVGEEATEQINRNDRKLNAEKEELSRKMRQDDKIHKAEISAITMRFENKQKLLEDETKSLNTNLRQVRKERETLQERLDATAQELHNVRDEYLDTQSKLDSTANAFAALKNSREGIDKQLEELQSRVAKLDQERNDVKAKAAKEKSTYELKISDLQDKLAQYEGQQVKMSAYALRTRNLSPTSTPRSRGGAAGDSDLGGASDGRERVEVLEKALKRSEKDISEAKAQVTAVKLDKERETDLLRAKIRELQDKMKPMTDAHDNLKLQYDIMRTECEIIRIERDDLAERLAEDESCQIKERGKIDQILAEIQRLKDVAPLFSSEEDVSPAPVPKVPSPSAAGRDRAARARERDKFYDEKSATLAVTDHKKYKGKKSADLQKAIDNITKVSEDIKAERRSRRPILPHKRSHSASLAEPGPSQNAVIRRFPSVDAEDVETTVVTLPAPTPLRSIPKVNYPARNPRFPSIPPSFLVTPPSVMREHDRSLSRMPAPDLSASVGAVSEECFRDPGGSWDSIDSDSSLQSWNYPLVRDALPVKDARFVSLPNLPQKVDSATSTEDRPKRTIMDAALAKKKKILARLHSNHSSQESLKERVEVSSSDGSSGFFERLSHPTMATQTSRTPSPSPQPSVHKMPLSTPSAKPTAAPSPLAEAATSAKTVVAPAAAVPTAAATTQKEVEKTTTPSTSAASAPSELINSKKEVGGSAPSSSKEPPASTSKDPVGKLKPKEKDEPATKKPLINTWRKPISDLAKKFENKGK